LADRGSDSNNRYKAKQIRKRRRTTKYTNLQKRIAKLEAQDEARFEKLEKKVEFLERELKNVDVDVFATCCY
jgi:cell division protein FtsB